jgi:hypothetical protein
MIEMVGSLQGALSVRSEQNDVVLQQLRREIAGLKKWRDDAVQQGVEAATNIQKEFKAVRLAVTKREQALVRQINEIVDQKVDELDSHISEREEVETKVRKLQDSVGRFDLYSI